jgi:hypothetical protein
LPAGEELLPAERGESVDGRPIGPALLERDLIEAILSCAHPLLESIDNWVDLAALVADDSGLLVEPLACEVDSCKSISEERPAAVVEVRKSMAS